MFILCSRSDVYQRMKTLFSLSCSLGFIHLFGRHSLAPLNCQSKSGRRPRPNDTSSKSSHAVGYNRPSQQAARATHARTAAAAGQPKQTSGSPRRGLPNFVTEKRDNTTPFLFLNCLSSRWYFALLSDLGCDCQSLPRAQTSRTFPPPPLLLPLLLLPPDRIHLGGGSELPLLRAFPLLTWHCQSWPPSPPQRPWRKLPSSHTWWK